MKPTTPEMRSIVIETSQTDFCCMPTSERDGKGPEITRVRGIRMGKRILRTTVNLPKPYTEKDFGEMECAIPAPLADRLAAVFETYKDKPTCEKHTIQEVASLELTFNCGRIALELAWGIKVNDFKEALGYLSEQYKIAIEATQGGDALPGVEKAQAGDLVVWASTDPVFDPFVGSEGDNIFPVHHVATSLGSGWLLGMSGLNGIFELAPVEKSASITDHYNAGADAYLGRYFSQVPLIKEPKVLPRPADIDDPDSA